MYDMYVYIELFYSCTSDEKDLNLMFRAFSIPYINGVWSYLQIKLNNHFQNRKHKKLWITTWFKHRTANINLHFDFQYNCYKFLNMPMNLTK